MNDPSTASRGTRPALLFAPVARIALVALVALAVLTLTTRSASADLSDPQDFFECAFANVGAWTPDCFGPGTPQSGLIPIPLDVDTFFGDASARGAILGDGDGSAVAIPIVAYCAFCTSEVVTLVDASDDLGQVNGFAGTFYCVFCESTANALVLTNSGNGEAWGSAISGTFGDFASSTADTEIDVDCPLGCTANGLSFAFALGTFADADAWTVIHINSNCEMCSSSALNTTSGAVALGFGSEAEAGSVGTVDLCYLCAGEAESYAIASGAFSEAESFAELSLGGTEVFNCVMCGGGATSTAWADGAFSEADSTAVVSTVASCIICLGAADSDAFAIGFASEATSKAVVEYSGACLGCGAEADSFALAFGAFSSADSSAKAYVENCIGCEPALANSFAIAGTASSAESKSVASMIGCMQCVVTAEGGATALFFSDAAAKNIAKAENDAGAVSATGEAFAFFGSDASVTNIAVGIEEGAQATAQGDATATVFSSSDVKNVAVADGEGAYAASGGSCEATVFSSCSSENVALALGDRTLAAATGNASATSGSVAEKSAKAVAVNDGCCDADTSTAAAQSEAHAANQSYARSNATALGVDTALPGADIGHGAIATSYAFACTNGTVASGSGCVALSNADAKASDTASALSASEAITTNGGKAGSSSKAVATGGADVIVGQEPGYKPSDANSIVTAVASGSSSYAGASGESYASNGGTANTATYVSALPSTEAGAGFSYSYSCQIAQGSCAEAKGVVANSSSGSLATGVAGATSNVAQQTATATVAATGASCDTAGAPVMTSSVDSITGKKTVDVRYNRGAACAETSATLTNPAP